jgi:hypothetical protein
MQKGDFMSAKMGGQSVSVKLIKKKKILWMEYWFCEWQSRITYLDNSESTYNSCGWINAKNIY